MQPLTAEWVAKAEEDYRSASWLLQAPMPAYNSVCFHAQQCVEKYMKAVLQEARRQFPRTHNLVELLQLGHDLMPDLLPHATELRALSYNAVEVRYPGEDAGETEAVASVALMNEVRALLRQRLGL